MTDRSSPTNTSSSDRVAYGLRVEGFSADRDLLLGGMVFLAWHDSGPELSRVSPPERLPYPILLVLGGLGLGFVPGVPERRGPVSVRGSR